VVGRLLAQPVIDEFVLVRHRGRAGKRLLEAVGAAVARGAQAGVLPPEGGGHHARRRQQPRSQQQTHVGNQRAPRDLQHKQCIPFYYYNNIYISIIAARVTFTGRRALAAPNRGRPSE